MIVLDTSGLLAALFPDQRLHAAAAQALREADPPLLLTPFVLAELDYLVARLAGIKVELELLAEVAKGAYELVLFGAAEVEECRTLVGQFADLGIGLADASVAVTARKFGTRDVLTLDERHFRVLPGRRDQPLRLLPADRSE